MDKQEHMKENKTRCDNDDKNNKPVTEKNSTELNRTEVLLVLDN